MNSIKEILEKLQLTDIKGKYDNHFYVIDLEDSNEYAKMYTQLDKLAVNTESPSIGQTSDGAVGDITNYFEIEDELGVSYNIFLRANFNEDKYYIRIGER